MVCWINTAKEIKRALPIATKRSQYGLYFAGAIGYRIDINGSQIPLHYGEIKVTRDKYHVIPLLGEQAA